MVALAQKSDPKEGSMVEFALVLLAIGLFDLAVVWFGADSRDGNDWVNHRPP